MHEFAPRRKYSACSTDLMYELDLFFRIALESFADGCQDMIGNINGLANTIQIAVIDIGKQNKIGDQ